ncbi:MAG: DUF2889 domain-containing protein [Deltaproteobacteria bacterium]|nr:DUF2889 domain-containing protein [Deltaproteobacteria bacterium]
MLRNKLEEPFFQPTLAKFGEIEFMPHAKRSITIEAEPKEDGKVEICALLKDFICPDFVMHQIKINLLIDRKRQEILAIKGKFSSPPFPVCEQALENLSQLEGISFQKEFRRKVLHLMGGAEGCTHLTTLILEVGATRGVLFNGSDEYDHLREGRKDCFDDPESSDKFRDYVMENYPRVRNACIVFKNED